jgi:hypothetical protein
MNDTPPLTPAQCAIIRACTYKTPRGWVLGTKEQEDIDLLISLKYIKELAGANVIATEAGLNAATRSGG